MTDFLALLHRDHHDLEVGLDDLLEAVPLSQIRGALDGVRLGLTAHAEAEYVVLCAALRRIDDREVLEPYVGQAREAHLAQEGALASLVCTRPGTSSWRERARFLYELVREHALFEEETVARAIQRHAPEIYEELAGEFATERLRQLSWQQPSAPIVTASAARAS